MLINFIYGLNSLISYRTKILFDKKLKICWQKLQILERAAQTKEILLFEKGEEQKVSYTRISLESPSLLNQADLPK